MDDGTKLKEQSSALRGEKPSHDHALGVAKTSDHVEQGQERKL